MMGVWERYIPCFEALRVRGMARERSVTLELRAWRWVTKAVVRQLTFRGLKEKYE